MEYCDGCFELQERLDALQAQMDAQLAMQAPRTPSGMAPSKCGCGLLVTREIRVVHPVAGQTSSWQCDYCTPRDVYGDGKRELQSVDYGTARDVAWARQINETLHGKAA